jgi:hypothetical protein
MAVGVYLSVIHFNEVDFRVPPILIDDKDGGKRVHMHSLKKGIPLTITGAGHYRMQMSILRRNGGRAGYGFSLYDDQYRLVERQSVPLADFAVAYQGGSESVTALVRDTLSKWISTKGNGDFERGSIDFDGFYKLVGESVMQSLKNIIEKTEKQRVPVRKNAPVRQNDTRHKLYHNHRISAA